LASGSGNKLANNTSERPLAQSLVTMKILVKVKAGAKKEFVRKIDDGNFIVSVNAAAKKGKANSAVMLILADYFHIPKANVKILSGHISKTKVMRIHV